MYHPNRPRPSDPRKAHTGEPGCSKRVAGNTLSGGSMGGHGAPHPSSKVRALSDQSKPTLVSTWSDGMVTIDIRGKRYTYQVDGALVSRIRREWSSRPWWVVNKLLRGREVK